MSSDRLDPDAILKAIKQEDARQGGKLRVFLGMSAGVGKTYAMLRAAQQSHNEGAKVIVGVVETHGRKETAALLEGLTILPRKKLEYRGTVLEEMDLDAILEIKPDLVIVDELAHTNAPGSRHEKRYQDVIEILEAGINVFTAINVQHLESRKDTVESITGIQIRETVPDSILERASLVEVVDIAPSELLKRLKEGKVYLGDKAERAIQNFFKEDRLTALREMALRLTAERVDHDLQRLISTRQESSPWQTNERLLVAISHSPYSEKLIRATRRLAYNLEAPWIAVHVDTGITLNDQDQAQLVKNLNLARELNAEVITTTETDVASAVRRISRQKNVTQVVVGRPTRRWFRDVIEGGPLLDRLVNESIEIDVHVIRQDRQTKYKPSLIDEISYYRTRTGPAKYLYTFLFLLAVSIVGWAIEDFIGYRSVAFLYLLAVIIVGMFGSIGAVISAAAISALTWNFFFTNPKKTFSMQNTDDVLMMIAFFVVATITGFLTNRLRFHERLIREREERTNVLYEILQDIANSQEKSEFLKKVIDRVGTLLNAKCGIVLSNTQEELDFDDSKPYSIPLEEKERAVALWALQNEKSAGWSTDTLSQAKALFVPLKGHSRIVGIFIFEPNNRARKLDLEQENLLLSILRQLGSSLERHFLARRLAEAQRLKDSEELHQTLLNSISHEIRTPLTAILGSASSLEDEKIASSPSDVKSISSSLQEAGDRLNRVIENLLDMSRLNSGVLALKYEWHDLNDLLGVTLKKLKKPLVSHKVRVEADEKVRLVKMDFRLMEHAISNLLINAAMYSPKNTEIKITLRYSDEHCQLVIEDEGPGIPESSLDKIFDKFYRVPGTPTGGTGLGLSIVKSIVELHKGRIQIENRSPTGARFTIMLPLEAQPTIPGELS